MPAMLLSAPSSPGTPYGKALAPTSLRFWMLTPSALTKLLGAIGQAHKHSLVSQSSKDIQCIFRDAVQCIAN
eukprot:scaffold35278_cov33-Tisochrysis_lutea.AAC.1